MKKSMSSILYILCIFTLLLAGMVLFLEDSEAATYNFYFNNTEQGANSTATPNLIVKDANGGISNAKNGSSEVTTPNSTTPSENPQPVPIENSTNGTLFEPTEPRDFAFLRFFGGLGNTSSAHSPIVNTNGGFWDRPGTKYVPGNKIKENLTSPLLSASLFISKNFALSFLMGRLWGPELEFYFLNQGKRGFQSAILIGFLKDNNRKYVSENDLIDSDFYGIKKYQSHLGVNINYVFNDKVGITTAYRHGLGSNSNYVTSTVSGGILFYL